MTELSTTSMSNFLAAIQSCEDVNELLAKVRQLNALKAALQAARLFNEKSCLFARLEAEALIRVCELGGLKELKGYNKKAAQWLYEMSEAEKQSIINQCGDGITLGQLYKRLVHDKEKLGIEIDMANYWKEQAAEELAVYGIVDFERYSSWITSSLSPYDPKLAADIVDGLRMDLRKAGGHGTSEGQYILPLSKDAKEEFTLHYQEIQKALMTKLDNFFNVFFSMQQFAKTANIKLSKAEIKGCIKNGQDRSSDDREYMAKQPAVYDFFDAWDLLEKE